MSSVDGRHRFSHCCGETGCWCLKEETPPGFPGDVVQLLCDEQTCLLVATVTADPLPATLNWYFDVFWMISVLSSAQRSAGPRCCWSALMLIYLWDNTAVSALLALNFTCCRLTEYLQVLHFIFHHYCKEFYIFCLLLVYFFLISCIYLFILFSHV